ncbi:hypothetical protein ASPWEDRAFT_69141 [Aspergillus wentii DTO 134E9]|uniref:Jacalin-type lectin domain-containing protein n=1 Tax=Aspergillus wentii DTO 134E9 TaxID=1073089 RepID=A0A1L9RLV6_ASPWE|nr:uncharacterized protein ASPWEDRAFT_69141 [Aspergillus wentii DTO 134E9]KAI9929676.1 hypothetical protein MW887_001151 [Aspergillus wentii]OJJ35873.1 hypothetical protein ASPWEDRAFT_69141 [Aspergillus wentii DTO 134E9]
MVLSRWFGGNGGHAGKAQAEFPNNTLKIIEIATGWQDGSQVVAGIKLKWVGGEIQRFGTSLDNHYVARFFDDDETIETMVVGSGDMVDSIYIKSSKGQELQGGGDGGTKRQVDVGKGILLRADIYSGDNLDAIRFDFMD